MKELLLSTIENYIRSKGGKASVKELSEHFKGTETIALYKERTEISRRGKITEHITREELHSTPNYNIYVFNRFFELLRYKETETELTWERFTENLKELNLRFEMLDRTIILIETRAKFIARLIDNKTEEYCYINEMLFNKFLCRIIPEELLNGDQKVTRKHL